MSAFGGKADIGEDRSRMSAFSHKRTYCILIVDLHLQLVGQFLLSVYCFDVTNYLVPILSSETRSGREE